MLRQGDRQGVWIGLGGHVLYEYVHGALEEIHGAIVDTEGDGPPKLMA